MGGLGLFKVYLGWVLVGLGLAWGWFGGWLWVELSYVSGCKGASSGARGGCLGTVAAGCGLVGSGLGRGGGPYPCVGGGGGVLGTGTRYTMLCIYICMYSA